MIDMHRMTAANINADAARRALHLLLHFGGGGGATSTTTESGAGGGLSSSGSSDDGVEHEKDFGSRTSSIVQ